MPPKSPKMAKPKERSRRTKAQLAEDLKNAGEVVKGKPTAAAVKRSRLAANARAESASVEAQTSNSIKCPAGPSLDVEDYQTLIGYLMKPSFRAAFLGSGSQTKVTGMSMGSTSLLNPVAIKINSAYNERHNSTDMRLTGRTLYSRWKRYKAKYMRTKEFSKKTGAGLSAKDVARGINTMEELLESMCTCYNDMDALFRDKGNVDPFGILDSGLSPEASSEDEGAPPVESEDDTTNGLDHPHEATQTDGKSANRPVSRAKAIREERPARLRPARFASPDAEEMEALKDLEEAALQDHLGSPIKSPQQRRASAQGSTLNDHYRNFLDNDLQSPPPTPKELNDPPADARPKGSTSSLGKNNLGKSSQITAKRKRNNKDSLTAEERALDSSSDEEPKPTQSTSSRAPISRRALDPLPSIDPSVVRGKDLKHPVATAMQLGNAAKLEMLRGAQLADLEARNKDLDWQKKKYYMEREDEAKRQELTWKNERQSFCQKLVLGGKTPAELEAILQIVYPEEGR